MKYCYFNFFLIVGLTLLMVSCADVSKKKTTMEVEDNNRHYYPILTGQVKDVSFKLKNTGKNPLMITDVITSCGCIDVDGAGDIFTIPPDQERILTLKYKSTKNIGYVKHFITLYGNFEDTKYKELIFDINVVPDAMYTKDYEELYAEEVKSSGGVEEFVDGNAAQKGYYVD